MTEQRYFRSVRWLILAAAALALAAASRADPLPSVVARIKPSVLAVGFYMETQNPRFGFRGTGFVVGDGNLLVTNAHVIERAGDVASGANLVVHSREGGDQGRIRRAEVVEVD